MVEDASATSQRRQTTALPLTQQRQSQERRRRQRSNRRSSFAYCLIAILTILFPWFAFQGRFNPYDSLSTLQADTPYSNRNNNNNNNHVHECPMGWTHERCQRRYEEVSASIQVHERIRLEMEETARQRSQREENSRGRTQQVLKAEHESYFEKVQQALGIPTVGEEDAESLPLFSPWSNFSYNSFADLSIVGFPKAGTSQLYNLLVSHPQVDPVFKRKEYCMDHGHFLDYTLPQHLTNPNTLLALRKQLFGYHKYMLTKRTQSNDVDNNNNKSIQYVNACLEPREIEYHLSYTQMPKSSKFLFLFRDPADWLWASWNFWRDKQLDLRPAIDHDWATRGVHYRSPELFHELILSRELLTTAGQRFRKMREMTVHIPRRLIHILGKEEQKGGRDRILFLRSEDMRATNGKIPDFLERLGTFTGLSIDDFNRTVAYGETNCNAQKGANHLCLVGTTEQEEQEGGRNVSTSSTTITNKKMGYPITHFRPMLEETRKFIYLQFWEECKIWKIEFGIVYQDCLDVL